jgi:L-threonylcarbamoyladenylate synthase
MVKAEIIKIDPANVDKEAIKFAATVLRNGGLVVFPTETVYGIGANALDENATRKLRAVKKRPPFKPFTLHISSVDMIKEMKCEITPQAQALMSKFWPGPLTLILGRFDAVKVGFRMPANAVAKALIAAAGVPIAASSANLSGEGPATSAEEVLAAMPHGTDLILDGGPTEFGKESTIIDTTVEPYKVVREGAISRERIIDLING